MNINGLQDGFKLNNKVVLIMVGLPAKGKVNLYSIKDIFIT